MLERWSREFVGVMGRLRRVVQREEVLKVVTIEKLREKLRQIYKSYIRVVNIIKKEQNSSKIVRVTKSDYTAHSQKIITKAKPKSPSNPHPSTSQREIHLSNIEISRNTSIYRTLEGPSAPDPHLNQKSQKSQKTKKSQISLKRRKKGLRSLSRQISKKQIEVFQRKSSHVPVVTIALDEEEGSEGDERVMTPRGRREEENFVSADVYLKTKGWLTRTLIEIPQQELDFELEKYKDAPISPLLPALPQNSQKYTLVLDMDETLIHYPEHPESEMDKYCYNLRPGLHKFLSKMEKYYEIIIFTAGTQEYADYILDQVDFWNKISHRLYRHHISPSDDVYHKDLGKLGRELSKCVIVDNLPENFERYPKNGIAIESWYDDLEDTKLTILSQVLERVALAKPEDIRVELEKHHAQLLDLA